LDLTHDYLRAVETYGLSYMDLKQMARESLEHSFLPGASIWEAVDHLRLVSACAANRTPSTGCKKFLDENGKARVQWKLEQEFAAFEKKF